MAAEREDPLVGFMFKLDLQGTVTGYFTECSGLGSEHEVVEHKVVGQDGKEITMKIPGRLKWSDLTLKRGITKDMQIWEWRKMVEDGNVKAARKNGTITMLDREYNPAAQWDFTDAWPSKVSGPTPKADSNEIGVEEMTIVFETYKRVKV
jgi:phage tail-like protein